MSLTTGPVRASNLFAPRVARITGSVIDSSV